MSRIRIREPLLPYFHHSGLQRQQICLRAVIEIPLVALEAHPPRADPPIDLATGLGFQSRCLPNR